MGRQRTWTVLEGRRKGLSIPRGVGRRVVRIGVRGRGGSSGAVGYAVGRAGRRCEFNRRIDWAFRAQTGVGVCGKQQVGRGVLLGHAVDSRVE